MDNSQGATLVTGATGFLGGLVAAALLADERRRLLFPVRSTATSVNCLARVRLALLHRGIGEQSAEELLRLVTVVALPPLNNLNELDEIVSSQGVEEIVHCAGCVDYFDKRQLQLGNVEMTSRLLEAARHWQLRRFFYLSTSYCAGYRSNPIPECLHPDPAPADEPTEYTRSKRTAEWCIAESGVPFIIIRPSIVIGDSRTGVYTGKNYGLYQMWRAIEGLLCREYSRIWFTVAPPVPLNFVHQDAFQDGFLGIYRHVLPNSVVHLVADDRKSPTMRELCWLWARVYCPVEIHCYARVDDVPLYAIPIRQRRFLELTAKNFEISTRTWKFETHHLDRLRAAGLNFPDATLESVARCQSRYIENSPRIQEHMKQHGCPPGEQPRLVDLSVR